MTRWRRMHEVWGLIPCRQWRSVGRGTYPGRTLKERKRPLGKGLGIQEALSI